VGDPVAVAVGEGTAERVGGTEGTGTEGRGEGEGRGEALPEALPLGVRVRVCDSEWVSLPGALVLTVGDAEGAGDCVCVPMEGGVGGAEGGALREGGGVGLSAAALVGAGE